jgi:hypothetical protein
MPHTSPTVERGALPLMAKLIPKAKPQVWLGFCERVSHVEKEGGDYGDERGSSSSDRRLVSLVHSDLLHVCRHCTKHESA